jgi:hypothetical protein
MNNEPSSTPPPLEQPQKTKSHTVRNVAILAVLFILGIAVLLVAVGGFVVARGFASKANDEVFTPTRFDADYASWKKGLERLKGQHGLGSAAPAEPF